MKIVFPVTTRNSALYEQMAKIFHKIGPQKHHSVLIVSCPSVLEKAQEFGEEISRLFATVEVEKLPNHIEKGHTPRNTMFRDAVYILDAKRGNEPWIWMEDAYPLERDWLDSVEEEWNSKPRDRDFLGCIEKTYFVATAEQVEKAREQNPDLGEGPHFHPSGQHMRFGVYPPDFGSRVLGIAALSQTKIPFEVYLQDSIIPYCHPSKTIKTVWASVDFERNNHTIVGKQSPEYESEIRKDERKQASEIDVAIIHGCRDGSLGMPLLTKEYRKARKAKPSKKGEIDAKELEDEIEALKKENAELRERIKELETKAPAEVETEKPAEEGEKDFEEPKEEKPAPAKKKRGRPPKKKTASA